MILQTFLVVISGETFFILDTRHAQNNINWKYANFNALIIDLSEWLSTSSGSTR